MKEKRIDLIMKEVEKHGIVSLDTILKISEKQSMRKQNW